LVEVVLEHPASLCQACHESHGANGRAANARDKLGLIITLRCSGLRVR
jgi:hypothetical protein